MENLVVSIFNTESEAYQSFADLKAFRQTQTTKVAQIALVKNENGHIVEKERYDFEDSTTDAALEGGLFGAVIGLLGGPIGVLFGYGMGSLYGLAAGDTIDTAETGLIDVVSQKLTNGETAVVALVQEDNEAVIDASLHQVRHPNRALGCSNRRSRNRSSSASPRRPLQPSACTNEG